MTIITFYFDTNPDKTLNDHVWPCDQVVPEDGNFDSYTNVHTCSCATCDQSCAAPNVNADIAFLDGFDGSLVVFTYIYLAIFSLGFQVIKHFYVNKKRKQVEKEFNHLNSQEIESTNNDEGQTTDIREKSRNKINDSHSSANFQQTQARLLEKSKDSKLFKDE